MRQEVAAIVLTSLVLGGCGTEHRSESVEDQAGDRVFNVCRTMTYTQLADAYDAPLDTLGMISRRVARQAVAISELNLRGPISAGDVTLPTGTDRERLVNDLAGGCGAVQKDLLRLDVKYTK